MQRNRLQSGLVVKSAEGTRLGTVSGCDAESFTIAAGEFFDEPYRAAYDEIVAYKSGEIFLNRHNEQLVHERRQIPAVGAAVPYAMEEAREIEIGLEISNNGETASSPDASKEDAA